ncbi:L-rhamnose mutarotase [Streptomyces sp. NBC_01463]|uniref:L-rhamnose mutarotase n=1 Tax=Streptomyces sp. NPDC050392 TaxID=3155782 RepID=UPI0032513207
MRQTDTAPSEARIHVTGRRTRVRPGMEIRYATVHAEIPSAVCDALASCGVARWQIWRDGRDLFHLIETTDRYEVMVERMLRIGPVDPDWDAIISELLEDGTDADEILPLVWTMTGTAQFAGAEGDVLPAPAN